MTVEQRRLLDVYVFKRPQWLGDLGNAIAVSLRALDVGSTVPVETINCLRDRGDRLATFPELEASVRALLVKIVEAAP